MLCYSLVIFAVSLPNCSVFCVLQNIWAHFGEEYRTKDVSPSLLPLHLLASFFSFLSAYVVVCNSLQSTDPRISVTFIICTIHDLRIHFTVFIVYRGGIYDHKHAICYLFIYYSTRFFQ